MKAISIRQPWAWLILHAGKDVENRTWQTNVRGRVLIHASKCMTHAEYDDAKNFVLSAIDGVLSTTIPRFSEHLLGGIVGSVEIVDCVSRSDSRWFFGRYGFVLRDPQPLPFRPMRGSLGFFEVPEA